MGLHSDEMKVYRKIIWYHEVAVPCYHAIMLSYYFENLASYRMPLLFCTLRCVRTEFRLNKGQ
jgi:hypothetical protein